ncbi:hypothetical protein HMN09_00332700 [Mycena chlorophos]|uniref:Uncharacterized protein n=1 Tax=Mycena chlorophos TaxID=658473 RepID=A0A8H6WHV4_MYCCL|nr:hypothetical protein HMN09_00332700 [Mycena chlorophos]
MKFFALLASISAACAGVAAIPVPETHLVSPYATKFTQRAGALAQSNRLRDNAPGLVLRIPDAVERIARMDENDIFLARALEDPIFASAKDFAAARVRSAQIQQPPVERDSSDSLL